MNLNTRYLGLELKNPLVPAASPLSTNIDGLCRLEDAGAAAVTLFSVFEEQIEHEIEQMAHYLDYGSDSYGEATSYFPEPTDYHRGPEDYLELIRIAKQRLSIPVIASLNGSSKGGWAKYAKEIAAAGADALELNVNWIETDPTSTGAEVEARYTDVVQLVANAVAIPVTVKVGPYFSALANLARRFSQVGAKGLVLFNRFYQPDFDLESRTVSPNLTLSNPAEMRLPLHWIAILYGRVDLNLALSTGVHSAADVIKAMMAGARVATCASALLANGPGHLLTMLREIEAWMVVHEYESIQQMQGSMSYQKVPNPSAYERANYMKELQSFRPDPVLLR
ncbi:MAG: dihydroorotate dehydrogenase-like protein [Fimbriimonadaceae bacterium]|nr:dihydroorotate dehydrogenase-like protein [Fimbriimonadaceae bacterium]